MSYGRKVLSPQTGIPISIMADGKPEWKTGGITIDWDTVAAVVAATDVNGYTVPIGQKYLRYGQVMCKITTTQSSSSSNTTGIHNAQLYGPYDPLATDGRQTLTRGQCFILNDTIFQTAPFALGADTDNVGVVEGGAVFGDRCKFTTSSASLSAGPTKTNFLAAFPRVTLVELD